MKARLAIAAAVLQVAVLAFMAGQREWISRFGDQLTLRTAPIDPNDPMRGAYVRLDYEISTVPAALCRGAVAEWTKLTDYRLQQQLRDRVVFAALRVNEHGIADLVALSDEQPADGPSIRGRVQWADTNGVQVRYGIEAMFTSKENALELENMARNTRLGAPMNVHVAAGSSGIGVLRSYDWEPLGITIELDRPPRVITVPPQPQEQNQQPRLTGLTVTLHNYSEGDVAIVDLPGARSFRLVQNNRFRQTHYAWAGDNLATLPAPTPASIVVLKPGEVRKTHIDLNDRRWWVVDTDKPGSAPIPIGDIQDGWAASFRIEYAPPAADSLAGLPNAAIVRHAPLRSRAFNAAMGMD